MCDDTFLPFSFPAVRGKRRTAAFDGGRITSDGGVMLPAAAERRLGLADRLAAGIRGPRDPGRVTHAVADILRARIFALACGYGDADDLDRRRTDPALKLACGRLPDTGLDLCSQPTPSRMENLPDPRTVIRLGHVPVDLWPASYDAPPASVALDIDDTPDVVHGHQQLSPFNAHDDERCFPPIRIDDPATGRPVAMILRPGQTPTGEETRGHVRRLVRRIRRRRPSTRIRLRGDGHYGRAEVMEWCEENGVDSAFGLPGNQILQRLVDEAAADIRTRRALERQPMLRGFAETQSAAKSWNVERRTCARIEASTLGLDLRVVVTNLADGSAEHIHDVIYCARGRAETRIKMRNSRLASDRTSCRSPIANRVRLVLHTAACWLRRTVRTRMPEAHALATAEFATLRLRLLGARGIETVSRVRLAFAAACPEADDLFRRIAVTLQPAAP